MNISTDRALKVNQKLLRNLVPIDVGDTEEATDPSKHWVCWTVCYRRARHLCQDPCTGHYNHRWYKTPHRPKTQPCTSINPISRGLLWLKMKNSSYKRFLFDDGLFVIFASFLQLKLTVVWLAVKGLNKYAWRIIVNQALFSVRTTRTR